MPGPFLFLDATLTTAGRDFSIVEAEKRLLGIDEQAFRAGGDEEAELRLAAGGDHVSEKGLAARDALRVNRDDGDETFGHAFLSQGSTHREAASFGLCRVLGGIAGDAGAVHPLVEEPGHRMFFFQRHGRGHDVFDLAFQVVI